MKASTRLLKDLRKKGIEPVELKGIYNIQEMENKVDYFDESIIQVDGLGKTPKDILSIRFPIDYVLIEVRINEIFPSLPKFRSDDILGIEIRNDNSVKLRTEDYEWKSGEKEMMVSYFKKYGSKIDFI